MRAALKLEPFSRSIGNRITGRHEYSVQLFEGAFQGGRVLSVGSAEGWFEQAVARRGVGVIGLERDPRQIDRARSNFPAGEFVQGDVLAIPFEDAGFDAVTMFEVLEHIPRGTEAKALTEVRRVLRPDGVFVMSTPNRNAAALLLDPAWYFGHRHYSGHRLGRLLEDAGFRVESIGLRGGLWELLAMDLHYVFKHVFSAEIPAREFWEARRRSEYSRDHGIATLFVQARVA